MRILSPELFQQVINATVIRPRIKREVRFATATTQLSDEDWHTTELLAISDRAGNKGILLLEDIDNNLYAAGYEVSRGITSSNGKAQPIICDFCRTWQTGSRSGSVTLHKPGRDAGSISFLCCADLQCSRHVRNLTPASKTSRSQLREDMDNDQRVARLRTRIKEIAGQLGIQPYVDDLEQA